MLTVYYFEKKLKGISITSKLSTFYSAILLR